MKVTFVTPVAYPSLGGNAVTVARLAEGLRARGVTVDVVDLSWTGVAGAPARLAASAPDVVHAFHAYRAGPAAAGFAGPSGRPLVISLTGTDVNVDLFHAAHREATVAALRAASALVAFHESIRATVTCEVPDVAARTEVIPQSVRLADDPYPLDPRHPRTPGEVRFLLPAGIRRLKNVLFPLGALEGLVGRHPVRLLLAGPVIEPDEGVRLVDALAARPWATWLGEVEHAHMASLLDQVDVVLNASLSEGGMANAVLEAMARGRAVLASAIAGNRSVIEDGVDGLLYHDAVDFARQAERLIVDAGLRARLGAAARAKVERLYPPERELDAHLALYQRLAAR